MKGLTIETVLRKHDLQMKLFVELFSDAKAAPWCILWTQSKWCLRPRGSRWSKMFATSAESAAQRLCIGLAASIACRPFFRLRNVEALLSAPMQANPDAREFDAGSGEGFYRYKGKKKKGQRALPLGKWKISRARGGHPRPLRTCC